MNDNSEQNENKDTEAEKIKAHFRETHDALEKMEKIKWGDTFQFDCHKDLDCWTACCKNSNIMLTPYDVLRLKRRLEMKSGEFLEKHTVSAVDPGFGLPSLQLKFEIEKGCPFVSQDGCGVYADRPTACRLYPLGAAVSSGSQQAHAQRTHFKIEEDYCLGWGEKNSMTVEDWVIDQEAVDYNLYNEMMIQMTFNPQLTDLGKLDDAKLGMFYMALYDLDRFREFVFNTSLFSKFKVESDIVEKIKEREEELLRFGMSWVEFSVMGAPTFELNK